MQVHGVRREVTSEPSNAAKEMERGLLMASSDTFEAKVQPSMLLSQHCGNMYAGTIRIIPYVLSQIGTFETRAQPSPLLSQHLGIRSAGTVMGV